MRRIATMALVAAFGVAALPTQAAAPVMMSPDWAKQACAAWNMDPVLTDGLVKSGWVDNDNKRGYKVMHVLRTECKDSRPVELRIAKQEGKAMCIYGGVIQNASLDGDVDYLMHAETERWIEMGLGDYGPMRAMMFGRLEFEGPKLEAMGNMGPFESFLLLVGRVLADFQTCPK